MALLDQRVCATDERDSQDRLLENPPRSHWAETRFARGGLAEEIASLKAEPGKAMIAHGGYTFVEALSRQGLIDEYRLIILTIKTTAKGE